MKQKIWIIIVIIVFALSIIFFMQPQLYSSSDEMIEAISADLSLDDNMSHELRYIDTIASSDKRSILLLCKFGGEQNDTKISTVYYAYQFDLIRNNSYELMKECLMSSFDHDDIQHLSWKDKYIVLINQPKVAYYEVISDSNEKNSHSVDAIPKVLTFDNDDYNKSLEIIFYDRNGERIKS